MDRDKDISVSVVIPAFNEEESIGELYRSLCEVLDGVEGKSEIIFVDDGSTDGTVKAISDLEQSSHTVKCVCLRRNFGKAIALSAGFNQVQGKFVITMDADLQDDPAEIPNLIHKLEEGYDLVSGWKSQRQDPLEKRIASKIFNGILSSASHIDLHDFNCGLKAYRYEVIKNLKIYGEHHRFIPVIAASQGFRVCELPVKHHPRKFGRSKYGVSRYFSGLFDFFTIIFLMNYERRPLHFLGKISLAPFVVGSLLILYVMFMKFVIHQTGNRPSLIAGVFFVGISLQVFLFGLIAELITHTSLSREMDCTQFQKDIFVVGEGKTEDKEAE